jgi:hypothetical protein
MNGIGLLITIGFCTIIWWGTRSYYIAIIKDMAKVNKMLADEILKADK